MESKYSKVYTYNLADSTVEDAHRYANETFAIVNLGGNKELAYIQVVDGTVHAQLGNGSIHPVPPGGLMFPSGVWGWHNFRDTGLIHVERLPVRVAARGLSLSGRNVSCFSPTYRYDMRLAARDHNVAEEIIAPRYPRTFAEFRDKHYEGLGVALSPAVALDHTGLVWFGTTKAGSWRLLDSSISVSGVLFGSKSIMRAINNLR